MELTSESSTNNDPASVVDVRWKHLKSIVLDSVTAPSSKRAYNLALDTFYTWYFSECRPAFSKAVVQEYKNVLQRRGHSPSTIGLYLSAVRKLAIEAADNGLLDGQIAAAVGRVRGPRRLGRRVGNWLTASQAAALINSPGTDTLKGVRDSAILATLLGCGLRRGEITTLDLGQMKIRDERWVIADLIGKHGRILTVPIPVWVKTLLDLWVARANISAGRIFRPVNKSDVINGEAITGQTLYEVIKTYGYRLHLPLAPDDLRRTFAKLAHAHGAQLEQIQYSLGHGSLVTTERYLGLQQNLKDSPGDRIRLLLQPPPLITAADSSSNRDLASHALIP